MKGRLNSTDGLFLFIAMAVTFVVLVNFSPTITGASVTNLKNLYTSQIFLALGLIGVFIFVIGNLIKRKI
jgi:hypothetical protein